MKTESDKAITDIVRGTKTSAILQKLKAKTRRKLVMMRINKKPIKSETSTENAEISSQETLVLERRERGLLPPCAHHEVFPLRKGQSYGQTMQGGSATRMAPEAGMNIKLFHENESVYSSFVSFEELKSWVALLASREG